MKWMAPLLRHLLSAVLFSFGKFHVDQTANGQITKTGFILSCCELKRGPWVGPPSGLVVYSNLSRKQCGYLVGEGGVWFVKENVVRIVIFICIVVHLGANQCYRYHFIVMFEDGQHHQASFSSTVPKLPITNTAFIWYYHFQYQKILILHRYFRNEHHVHKIICYYCALWQCMISIHEVKYLDI